MEEFDGPDYNELIDQFEEMLQGHQVRFFDAEELEIIADHYFQEGLETKAMQAIDLAYKLYPAAPNFPLMQARFFMEQSKMRDALKMIKRAELLDPESQELVLVKADFFSIKGQHKRAITFYQKALEFADYLGNRPEVVVNLANEHFSNGEPQKALVYYKEALETFSEDEFIVFNVKMCYDLLQDPTGCVAFFNGFVDENPFSEVGWFNLGIAHSEEEHYALAIRAFDYAILIDENFAAAYYEKGRVYELQENYQAAINTYLAGFEFFDPNGYSYFRIGVCARLMKNTRNAKVYFKKSLKMEPDMEEAHLELAVINLEEGNLTESAFHIRKTLVIDGDNLDYNIIAADIYRQAGLHLEAETRFRKAFELGGTAPELYISLAELLIELDEVEQALETVAKGIAVNPDSYDLLAVGAGYLLTLGDRTRALELMDRALILNPNVMEVLFDNFPHLAGDPDLKKYL